MEELRTYVLYDIEDDRIRGRIAEACKDYGLTRIQYSAFCGSLNRNRRGELYIRLSEELGEKAGKILILPVCEKDVKEERKIQNEHEDDDDSDGSAGHSAEGE